MFKGFDINTLLTLILGGGFAGSLVALIKSAGTFKDGAKSRERNTISDLITQREKAVEERNEEFEEKNFIADQRDYWRNWGADLEFILRTEGIEIPPRGPEPRRKNNEQS